jgi:DNA repair exonuclease SbcCD nuclease subunit
MISLRILEGTPRHDRKQAATLLRMTSTTPVDIQYHDQIYMGLDESLDKKILYIPDEASSTAAVTQDKVKQLLALNNWDKVDIIIMHGMFNFQLGRIPYSVKVHDEDFYLSIVNDFIAIGHIHTHSVLNKIVAPGSFDRLNHGEEEQKGGVLFNVFPQHTQFQFIPNKHANVYKRIKITKDKTDWHQISKQVSKVPEGSRIEFVIEPDHPLNDIDAMKRKFLTYIVSRKVVEKKKDEVKEVLLPLHYQPVILNENTLVPVLLEEVQKREPLQNDDLALLKKELEDINAT